ncbi:uncharacterized protein PHACADRAFT_105550 [Phanerochaete carnosa HHB-10118-sp]|uniref:DUF6532 domain-containing protein n=1 Tax=Phanerochaete carnosa (strain HHB-10118-sp) TaxID=650164 RepID=K5UKU8_PHACS|nr:uncharacterized protein PHACADRAFT_105550 [Phanerochaete carnosa HHB-10118-sp]EKM50271.1 hypothetical protein PHACADRAFT_105550 [Phanerochaete carnosa HHB-10118-sp]
MINGAEPFNRPLITQIIATIFFKPGRSRPSIAAQHTSRFRSSVHLAPHELEIPEPMLALACALVCFLALADWTSGMCKEASDYNITEAEKEYKKVLSFLDRVKKASLQMYHQVMH